MDYIMWPLMTKEGERWVVEQILESGEFEPVKEFDSEEEACVWVNAQLWVPGSVTGTGPLSNGTVS